MLLNQRDVFEIPEDIVYLNCAYMSPLPRSVREAGERAVSRKSQPWNIHANDFFEEVETARQLFAALIHTDSEGVALVPSASYGINVAATNLSIAQNQHILLLEEEFPSNVYAWQELAKRCGARVEMIRRPQEGNWARAILAHINEQTGIVAVPNCYWTDGGLVDLAQISRRVREIGAALVVDMWLLNIDRAYLLSSPGRAVRGVKIFLNWSIIDRRTSQEQGVLIWEKEAILSPCRWRTWL